MSNLPPAGTEPVPLGKPIGVPDTPTGTAQTQDAEVEVAAEHEDPSRFEQVNPVPTSPVVTPVKAPPIPQRHVSAQGPPPLPPKPVVAQSPPVLPARPQHQLISDTTHPSTDSRPSDPTAPKQAPTATMDPNVPSSKSAPTALPTNANTHPEDQKEAIKNEHPEVVHREVEKTKAAEREIKGEKPLGTVVRGVEDDRLYAMLRRFDQVSHHTNILLVVVLAKRVYSMC